MLILTRKIGEAINIGDDIRVIVIGIQDHQANLGIVAPRTIKVYREEVYQKAQRQRVSAKLTGKNERKSCDHHRRDQRDKRTNRIKNSEENMPCLIQ